MTACERPPARQWLHAPPRGPFTRSAGTVPARGGRSRGPWATCALYCSTGERAAAGALLLLYVWAVQLSSTVQPGQLHVRAPIYRLCCRQHVVDVAPSVAGFTASEGAGASTRGAAVGNVFIDLSGDGLAGDGLHPDGAGDDFSSPLMGVLGVAPPAGGQGLVDMLSVKPEPPPALRGGSRGEREEKSRPPALAPSAEPHSWVTLSRVLSQARTRAARATCAAPVVAERDFRVLSRRLTQQGSTKGI